MFKKNLKSFLKPAGFKAGFDQANETQLLALGSLLSKQQLLMQSNNLNDYEFKIFSQFGDDGIIQYLIKEIAIENEIFIEFGVEDFMESNSRFLMMNNNWSGFVMDASEESMLQLTRKNWYWKYDLTQKAVFIDRENINSLIAETRFENIGLIHIDLDGNDYYILEALDFSRINPSIVIMEYNSVFGSERTISIPYNKNFTRTDAHYSGMYVGASLAALNYIAEKKGYALVGCNLAGNNAYFVRKDLLTDRVKKVTIAAAYKQSKFREGRDKDGKLTYLRGDERLSLMKGLEIFNVVTQQLEIL